MAISHLLFDFAGVVGHHQSAETRWRLPQVAEAVIDVFWSAYWRHRDDYDAASLSAAQYWARVAADCSAPSPIVAELTQLDVESWLEPNTETLALVDELAAVGYRTALLSNAPVELAEAIERTPWMARFDPMVFSCRLRVSKPHTRCYEGALAEINAGPAQVVFIDDRQVNVDSARTAGMHALLFSDAKSLRADLIHLLE